MNHANASLAKDMRAARMWFRRQGMTYVAREDVLKHVEHIRAKRIENSVPCETQLHLTKQCLGVTLRSEQEWLAYMFVQDIVYNDALDMVACAMESPLHKDFDLYWGGVCRWKRSGGTLGTNSGLVYPQTRTLDCPSSLAEFAKPRFISRFIKVLETALGVKTCKPRKVHSRRWLGVLALLTCKRSNLISGRVALHLCALCGSVDAIARLPRDVLERTFRDLGCRWEETLANALNVLTYTEEAFGQIVDLTTLPGFGPKLASVLYTYGDGVVGWVGDVHTSRLVADTGVLPFYGVDKKEHIYYPRPLWTKNSKYPKSSDEIAAALREEGVTPTQCFRLFTLLNMLGQSMGKGEQRILNKFLKNVPSDEDLKKLAERAELALEEGERAKVAQRAQRAQCKRAERKRKRADVPTMRVGLEVDCHFTQVSEWQSTSMKLNASFECQLQCIALACHFICDACVVVKVVDVKFVVDFAIALQEHGVQAWEHGVVTRLVDDGVRLCIRHR